MLKEKEGLLHKLYRSSEGFNREVQVLLEERFQPRKHTLVKRLVLYLMIVFGAAWGVPWMESAAQAVAMLGIQSQAVQMLARVGIVIAVGVDGIWIMLVIHEMLFPHLKAKLRLRKAYRHQLKVLILSGALAVLSCIPGVYAAYLFNTGSDQYLAIITFFGNLGLATFGFYTLLFEVIRKVFQPANEPSTTAYQSKLQDMYHTIIRNQDKEDQPIIPLEVKTYEQFTKYIEEECKNYYPEDHGPLAPSIMLIIPLVFATVVASSQSLIDIVLTTGFFTERLEWEKVLSIVLACIFAIPNMIVSFLSSKEVASKILNVLFCRKKYNYLEHFYKKLTVLVAIVALIISIGAPTSACYIVYTSLKTVSQQLAVASSISLLLARLCFSNYTSRVLFSKLLISWLNKPRPTEQSNTHLIFQLMERVHPQNYLLVGVRTNNEEQLPAAAI